MCGSALRALNISAALFESSNASEAAVFAPNVSAKVESSWATSLRKLDLS